MHRYPSQQWRAIFLRHQDLSIGINEIEGLPCNPQDTETNIVFFDIDKLLGDGASFCRKLSENGVLSEALDSHRIRYVTHLGVSKSDIERAIQITAKTCKHVSI